MMTDPRLDLTASLHERGVLDATTALVAAWTGRLMKVTGADFDIDTTDASVALLGVSEHTGYLLSRFGLISFALAEIRAPHSQRPGHLGFTVVPAGGTRVVIDLLTDMPLAIAAQLDEMRRLATTTAAIAAPRRPPAKRRTAA